jgi:hypothetical protein
VTCPYFARVPANWLQWWQDRGQASKGAPTPLGWFAESARGSVHGCSRGAYEAFGCLQARCSAAAGGWVQWQVGR